MKGAQGIDYAEIVTQNRPRPIEAKRTNKTSCAAPSIKQRFHAVVLAGAHSWGRTVLDRVMPRPLLPVANRQLVRYAIDWVDKAGANSIAICGNGNASQIRVALHEYRPRSASLEFYQDSMPRGPAGCIRDAVSYSCESPIIVVDAAILPTADLGRLLVAHCDAGDDMTVVISSRTGQDEEEDSAPIGIYIVSPRVLEHIPLAGYQDIKEGLIPRLHAAGLRVGAFLVDRPCCRVTGPASYMTANEWAIRTVQKESPWTPRSEFGADRRVGDAPAVHPTASVHSTARLLGPVLIGPHCVIQSNAVIVGPVSIGAGCSVQSSAVISRSAIWSGAIIESDAFLDRCIIGEQARVCAGESIRSVVRMEQSSALAHRTDSTAPEFANRITPNHAD